MEQRAIGPNEAKDLAESLSVSFVETSAKTCINVEELFVSLASDIYRKTVHENSRKDESKFVLDNEIYSDPNRKTKNCNC